MKQFVTICLSLLTLVSFSQSDTIQLRQVEITIPKITPSEAYKTLLFDSTKLSNNFANNLGELLEQNTSTYIKNAGIGQLATLSFRGTSAEHTQLYWNGISVNSPTLGMADLSIVPVAFVNNIEVHYGASGIVDGSGSIGGSIQMSQSANWNNKLHVGFKNQLASFNNNTQSLLLEVGNKKIQSQTNLFSQAATNNYSFVNISKAERPIENQTHSDFKNLGFTQNVYYRINLKNRFNFKGYYYKNNRNLPNAIGSAFSNESQTDEHLRSMLEWVNMDSKYKQSFKLAYLKDDQNYINEVSNIDSRILVNKVSLLYQYTRNLSSKTKLKSNFLNEYSNVVSSGFSTNKEQYITSLFASLEHQFSDRLLTNLISRQELLDFKITPFSPSLGARYKLHKTKKYFIKTNVSKTYRAPTLNARYWEGLGNPNLKPEQGWASELSFEAKSIKNSSISVTVFHNRIKNWILWQPDSTNQSKATNLNDVISKGIELEATKKITFKKVKITLSANYAYTDVRNTRANSVNDNSVDKQLIYVPFHKVNTQVNMAFKGYALSYSHNYTSKTFVLKDHSTYLPYFAPANISIAKNFKLNSESKVGVQFKVINLFNEDYHIVSNRPMPRRNFTLSLVYDFNK